MIFYNWSSAVLCTYHIYHVEICHHKVECNLCSWLNVMLLQSSDIHDHIFTFIGKNNKDNLDQHALSVCLDYEP